MIVDGIHHIDKVDFLSNYPFARTKAYTQSTIQNAFAGAGLFPLCAQRVLEKLNISINITPPRVVG